MSFSLFVYYNKTVHSSKTTRVTTSVQENFFCGLKKKQLNGAKTNHLSQGDFLQKRPGHEECGPGRTRRWASWKF